MLKQPQKSLKNTVQDIFKRNSHHIIKYPQYKVTLMQFTFHVEGSSIIFIYFFIYLRAELTV